MADDDLLARLNALKPSSVPSLTQSRTPDPDSEDELVKRFLRFRSLSPPAQDSTINDQEHHAPDNSEDQKTLKELLADVPAPSEWNVDAEDERNIEKLVADAQKHVSEDPNPELKESQSPPKPMEHALESPSQPEESLKQGPSDEALADEYLQQILDELDLEESKNHTEGSAPAQEEESQKDPLQEPDDAETPPIELPSAPSNEPLPLPSTSFSLPSAPQSAPTKPKQSKSNQPKYSDTEIETWCVICCDDASIKCLGCDGDLYCGNCWREGHTGPDAGFEEKTHKATRFHKPKGEEKAKTEVV